MDNIHNYWIKRERSEDVITPVIPKVKYYKSKDHNPILPKLIEIKIKVLVNSG